MECYFVNARLIRVAGREMGEEGRHVQSDKDQKYAPDTDFLNSALILLHSTDLEVNPRILLDPNMLSYSYA
jgi:hypothetical protein